MSNLSKVNATTYTATFTGAANTDISNASVSVTAGSWQDGNGNAGTGGSTVAFTVDTVTPSENTYQVIQLRWYGGVYLGGDAYADVFESTSGVPLEITSAVFEPDGAGNAIPSAPPTLIALGTDASLDWEQAILASVVLDADSNYVHPSFIMLRIGNIADLPFAVPIDAVTVSIDNTDVNVAHDTATVTFTFSEAPVGFTLTDTSAVGGTLSNLQQSDATHYTATFTGAADTDISNASVSVTAGSWQDGNSNAGAGGSTPAFIVDTVTPTVAVSIGNTFVNQAHTTGTVTFTFSEAPTAFNLADTSAVGGMLTNLQQTDATHYTATFTGAAQTRVTNASVRVAAGSWQENGNLGGGGSTALFEVDTLTTPAPPTVTVNSDPAAMRGQVIPLSTLVAISDRFGLGFQKLELWDSQGTTFGGQFVVNGTPQTGGHEIDLSPANVANTVFDVGTLGGTDALWAQLLQSNGQLSGWQQFTVTAPIAQLPTLSVSNSSAATRGQTIGLLSLLSILDPDHVGYTQLELWDSQGTTFGGQFVVNGAPQTGGHEIDVSPADVANPMFDVGTLGGMDTLWARLLQTDGTLTNWQQFTVTAPIDTPPMVTVANKTATHGQSFAASSLFTASDPDGDILTQYDFWDSGTGGGHFVLNGQTLGANQDNYISASQLPQTTYQSGSGTDTLWARANDGTVWGAWSQAFTVTAPVDPGPVVMPTSTKVSAINNQSFAALSLFRASDPFGDAITQYDLWNTGMNGGYFVLNGQALGANRDNYLTTTQLAQTAYQTGSGTDTLWVRVNEGGQWSAWSQSFTVSDMASPTQAATDNYNFTTLNEPRGTPTGSAGTFTLGLNDAGEVVGYYYDASGVHGYLYRGGNYTTLNYPSAVSTEAWGINNAGDIVGFSSDGNGGGNSFLYSGGSYITINNPLGTNGTTATGINNAGEIVGYFEDSSQSSYGFVYSGGNFVTLNDPLGTYGTFAYGINDKNQVVGSYIDSNQIGHGFLYSGGTYTPIDGPSGTPTVAFGINDAGEIVGFSRDGSFLYSNGIYTIIHDPLSTSTRNTDARGINNVDQIAGMYYGDQNDIVYGFLATSHAPADPGPVVVPAGINVSAIHNQNFAASNLFIASDPLGDAIAQYDFWDTGTGGGHFALNGVPLGTNQDNYVSAAQLAQIAYQSGSGADTLWVRASDGSAWSPWSQGFTVTAPIDSGPTVTSVSSIKTTAGQTFTASNLFTASDPFNDPIEQYDFWDTGAGGGHFMLNGQPLGTNQDNYISSAQLAQTSYVTGSGTDTLWVRVAEGGQWSPWSQSFTVSDPTMIGAGETLELTSAYSGQLSFAADTGTLKLDNAASFSGTVAGMTGADTIDFADLDPTKVQTPSYSGDASSGTLSVTDGTHTANIALLGSYLASTFVASSDGHGGTNVVEHAPTDHTSLLAQPQH